MTETHLTDDELVTLALQQVEPEEQARLSAHLEGCAGCRAEYADIENTVRHTLAAAPAIAPPAGFSGRVLAEMGLSEAEMGMSESAPRVGAGGRSGRRWTGLAVAAAALVVGLVGGIGLTLAVTGAPTPVASTPATATTAAELRKQSGEPVGTVGTLVLAGGAYVVVTVTQAKPGAAYDCIVVGHDGSRHPAGTWTLAAHYGGAEASGTWVVEAPTSDVARVELMTPSGALWASADL